MAKNKKILIVEDEGSLLRVINTKLESKGFETFTTKTVEDALEVVKEEDLDAIWLDHYLLGDEDGLAFINKMKDMSSNVRNIPIFLVSNTASEDKVMTYLRLGVDRYYTKTDNDLNDIAEDVVDYLVEDKD